MRQACSRSRPCPRMRSARTCLHGWPSTSAPPPHDHCLAALHVVGRRVAGRMDFVSCMCFTPKSMRSGTACCSMLSHMLAGSPVSYSGSQAGAWHALILMPARQVLTAAGAFLGLHTAAAPCALCSAMCILQPYILKAGEPYAAPESDADACAALQHHADQQCGRDQHAVPHRRCQLSRAASAEDDPARQLLLQLPGQKAHPVAA